MSWIFGICPMCERRAPMLSYPYCSNACKTHARRLEQAGIMLGVCAHCRKPVQDAAGERGRPRRYCSTECRNRAVLAQRARDDERFEDHLAHTINLLDQRHAHISEQTRLCRQALLDAKRQRDQDWQRTRTTALGLIEHLSEHASPWLATSQDRVVAAAVALADERTRISLGEHHASTQAATAFGHYVPLPGMNPFDGTTDGQAPWR